MTAASFEIVGPEGAQVLKASGDWTLMGGLISLDSRLRAVSRKDRAPFGAIDLSGISNLDTSGALMLQRIRHRVCGLEEPLAEISGAAERHRDLLERVEAHLELCQGDPPRRKSVVLMLDRVGRGSAHTIENFLSILSFVGAVVARMGGAFTHPKRFRVTPMVHHMEEAGLNSTLIVGLMSFLIGSTVAFMGARVLAEFGAEVFTVELVGISVLREFGVLLTAILVAGRSGSAFTAAIGSMKLREEIDAMRVMGINPLDALVIPRVLALVFMLPVLAFLAAFLGILGGGVVGWAALDIPPPLFTNRLQEFVTLENLFVGLVKAPFFAFVIAVVGCFHGMMVENSAEELGRRTTMAVVQSLFLVILIDALFAMFFLELGI